MSIFSCTMHGHIMYDDNITYQELMETEERVKVNMRAALEECGGQHFDFTPQADSLLVECVFPEVDREKNRAICDSVIRLFGSTVLARFMFVDKQMDGVVFYFLGRGKWHEQALSIPGPKEALSGWVVRQERKTGNAMPRRSAVDTKPVGPESDQKSGPESGHKPAPKPDAKPGPEPVPAKSGSSGRRKKG